MLAETAKVKAAKQLAADGATARQRAGRCAYEQAGWVADAPDLGACEPRGAPCVHARDGGGSPTPPLSQNVHGQI